jgi:hypothetical protein
MKTKQSGVDWVRKCNQALFGERSDRLVGVILFLLLLGTLILVFFGDPAPCTWDPVWKRCR